MHLLTTLATSNSLSQATFEVGLVKGIVAGAIVLVTVLVIGALFEGGRG